jgi:hypothetical protein
MDEKGPVIELGFTFHLLDDFKKCCGNLQGPDAQFWRRMAFRSLFGFLEAWMSINRQYFVPDMLRDHHERLLKTEEERAYVGTLLASTDPIEWMLNDNGLGYSRRRKLRFLPLLKAVVRLLHFVDGKTKAEADRHLGLACWSDIRRAIKIRDRITHPHVHEDVLIGDDDVRCLLTVSSWLTDFQRSIRLPDAPARYNDCSEE